MYKWGETNLNVSRYSYKPPYRVPSISEIQLVPGADLSVPGTVIQQGGRSRKRVKFEGYCTSLADYNALQDDWNSCIVRTFIGPDGETLSMMIEELKEATRIVSFKYEYSITLMEV